MALRVIRIETGGGRGDPPGRWRRRLVGLGLLVGIGLPLLIAAGVGVGLYQTFFRVPEFHIGGKIVCTR